MGWASTLAGRLARFVRRAFLPERLRLYAPALLALAYIPFFASLLGTELREPLFGDQLVFQYIGWCLRHGMRLYRDVGMADGPFIDFLHASMQLFVGSSDAGFRRADIVLETSGGLILGILLAPEARSRRLRWTLALSWGLFVAAAWISAYLTLDWAATTERETYYALFGSVGLIALYSADERGERGAYWSTFAGAFLVSSQVFGKPTGLAYVGAGALVCLLSRRTGAAHRKLLAAFAFGCLALLATMALLFLLFGSFSGYFFWCVLIPLRGNRYLFGTDWHRLLFSAWDAQRLLVFGMAIAGLFAIVFRILPRRALGLVAVGPILYIGAVLQARGFDYQVWPAVAASNLLVIVGASALWGASWSPRTRRSARPLVRLLAFAGAAYVAQGIFADYQHSPFRWNGKREALDHAQHQFADGEREAGDWLRANTSPNDRVFAYTPAGENAHVILLHAARRTASPFFHGFWLDPVGMLDKSEVKPDAQALAKLEALQAEVRRRACGAVEADPPRAMAFNTMDEVYKVCPDLRELLPRSYHVATTIRGITVYLRN
jgi:hypothetical protein